MPFESVREMAVVLKFFFARRAETMCEPMVPLAPTMAISLRWFIEPGVCWGVPEEAIVTLITGVGYRSRESLK
jgi:hypothetical protein